MIYYIIYIFTAATLLLHHFPDNDTAAWWAICDSRPLMRPLASRIIYYYTRTRIIHTYYAAVDTAVVLVRMLM